MSRAARWLAPALGAALCAAGVAVFRRTNTARRPGEGDWAAYAPLEAGQAYQSELTVTFDDRWSLLWTTGHLLGVGLLVLGLLVLAGWAGWRLARRWAGRRTRRTAPVLGALAGLLTIAGAVVLAAPARPPVVTYGGSYQPLSCPFLPGCGAAASVQLDAAQLAGLGAAVLGAAPLAGVAGWWAATSAGGQGRSGAAWGAVVAGALLSAAGVVLAAGAPAADPELVFLSPEQYDQLGTAAWLAGAGRVLVGVGALLVAGAAPWLVGGDRPVRARRAAGAVLGAGAGPAVLGAGLLWSARASRPAVEGTVPDALLGPGRWTGLVLVLVGGALLGAGARRVTGRRPAG